MAHNKLVTVALGILTWGFVLLRCAAPSVASECTLGCSNDGYHFGSACPEPEDLEDATITIASVRNGDYKPVLTVADNNELMYHLFDFEDKEVSSEVVGEFNGDTIKVKVIYDFVKSLDKQYQNHEDPDEHPQPTVHYYAALWRPEPDSAQPVAQEDELYIMNKGGFLDGHWGYCADIKEDYPDRRSGTAEESFDNVNPYKREIMNGFIEGKVESCTSEVIIKRDYEAGLDQTIAIESIWSDQWNNPVMVCPEPPEDSDLFAPEGNLTVTVPSSLHQNSDDHVSHVTVNRHSCSCENPHGDDMPPNAYKYERESHGYCCLRWKLADFFNNHGYNLAEKKWEEDQSSYNHGINPKAELSGTSVKAPFTKRRLLNLLRRPRGWEIRRFENGHYKPKPHGGDGNVVLVVVGIAALTAVGLYIAHFFK
eukprot:Nk52_evm9s2415 gene=Nk52_evmTU9s2415